MQWTPEQREHALTLLAQVGAAEAGRRTGIPAGTIASWGARGGVSAPLVSEQRVAGVNAKLVTMADRKARLAERMLTEAEAMIEQLHSKTIERKPMVVSDGAREGSHIEIAEVEYDRPPTGDQKRIVEAVAILVDKIQLLTGDATARIEQTGEAAAPKRAALVSVVSDLAAKRAS